MQEINGVLPLFKTNYSVGKSILTAEESSEPEEADSIFQIAKDRGLKTLCVLDDDIAGVIPLIRAAKKIKIPLVYGLVFKIGTEEQFHKISLFAKNAKGLESLAKLHAIGNAKTKLKGFISASDLKDGLSKDLKFCIPFYDSHIYCNLTSFDSFSFDAKEISEDVCYFIEDNKLAYDKIISDEVIRYCTSKKIPVKRVKTILYNSKDDFDSYVTYRCACSRENGKQRTLSNPNFDGMSSNEFCIESLYENV